MYGWKLKKDFLPENRRLPLTLGPGPQLPPVNQKAASASAYLSPGLVSWKMHKNAREIIPLTLIAFASAKYYSLSPKGARELEFKQDKTGRITLKYR